jgi:molecular chaperone IbpA
MSTIDFSPLFRSSIGFDRVFELLETASQFAVPDSWPPYDITKSGEDAYRLSMAVAGFAPDELEATLEPNLLVVRGNRRNPDNGEYLHRGITGGGFERRFELADHMKVTGANLQDGILTIDMVQELPEEMKPRRIEIRPGGSAPRQLAGKAQAA